MPPSGEIGGRANIKTFQHQKGNTWKKSWKPPELSNNVFQFWVGFQTGAWFWWLTELFNESLDWFSHLGLKKSGTTTETKRRRTARLLRWKHSEHKHCKIPKLAVELFQNNKDEEDFLSVNFQQNTIYFDFDHNLDKRTLWPESKKKDEGDQRGTEQPFIHHSAILAPSVKHPQLITSNSSLTELNPFWCHRAWEPTSDTHAVPS